MAIRAVVFDLFDTLVDLMSESIRMTRVEDRDVPRIVVDLHGAVSREAPIALGDFLDVMREMDRDFRLSHYANGLELPSSQRFAELVERLEVPTPGLDEELVDLHMSHLADQVRYLDHHREVLEALSGDVRIALCSNFSHSPTAMAVLERAQLADLFDLLVISDDVGIRKPRKEIFEAVFDGLDVAPCEVLHVGDSLQADVAGAAALGAGTVWITRRIADRGRALAGYEGPAPDHSIADLRELPAIVRTHANGS